MENKGDGLLSLFKSDIKGYVVYPYTGAVMSRKDVLDLYQYLAVKHVEDPEDKWSCEMLLQSKSLLSIPDDLHHDLLQELKSSGTDELHIGYKRPILEEVETLRFFRKGFCPGGAERSDREVPEAGPGMEFISDILELERGSLLFEMEDDPIDLGDDSAMSSGFMVGSDHSVMDDMLSPDRKGPKKR
ncbi:MAG: hypothetical protein ACMUHU_00415 [Thermoplasmatota archaeon]